MTITMHTIASENLPMILGGLVAVVSIVLAVFAIVEFGHSNPDYFLGVVGIAFGASALGISIYAVGRAEQTYRLLRAGLDNIPKQ
jgi:hypothetical protein